MAEQVYIGVDIGAESGRVAAGLWDGQRLRVEDLVRFPNGPVNIGDSLRWDVVGLWTRIKEGLAAAARRYGDAVVSAGVDTWGVDYALLSANSELLGLPYHYRDPRTRGVMDYALKLVPRAEVFAATGLQFMEINTLYQLLAMRRRNPEMFWIADRFLLMPDFFHWCLCGARVAEFTNATTTQCYNARQRAWAVDLLKRLELPTKMFPQIVTPGTRLGPLRPDIAQKTGLRRIQIVAPATHDTASAVAAAPTRSSGQADWAYLSAGTWCLLGVELPEALLSERVLEFNLTNEGGMDHTYRLLKNIMGLWLAHQCQAAFAEKGRELSNEQWQALASEATPFRSLIDPDDGRFLNPPDMPAAIQSFCRDTRQPVPETEGQFLRCIHESLALKYALVLDWLEALTGQPIHVVHVIGRNCHNPLLNAFTANACRRPVLAGPADAAVLGNLLAQVRASGEILSLQELRRVAGQSCSLVESDPDDAQADQWLAARARFSGLLARP